MYSARARTVCCTPPISDTFDPVLRCWVFLLGAALAVGADQKPPEPRTLDDLKTAVAKILAETKTPGAGIAIVTRDRVLLADGVGKANVAAGKPATADTLFRIGSVSKAFTSLSILQLQERGRLSLNDPVRKYAPEVPFNNRWEDTDPIRIVHLLEHTTGWDDLHLAEYASNDPKPLTLFEGLTYHPDSRVSRWRPGTRMSYCNSGPPVAAYVVEKITGKRFEDYVQQNLFAPLHMTTASYLLTPEVKQRLTTLYSSDGQRVEKYWHISLRPAGAINASPRDMANYVRFYLNRGSLDGTTIVKAESVERMERPESTMAARDGLRAGYGLSNYTTIDDRGFVWHGHDGGITGGLTEMAYMPEAGVGYVYMINATNGAAFERLHKLMTAYLTRGMPDPARPAPASVPSFAADYEGWYEPASPRVELTHFVERIGGLEHASFDRGKLVITRLPLSGNARTLVPVTDRVWREEKQPVATVALISDLRDGRFIADGETMAKIPAIEVWGELALIVFAAALMISSALYALYWIPARMLRRLRPVQGARLHLSVRALPLAAVLAFAAFIAMFIAAGNDAIALLGTVTVWSASILALSVLFALLSVLALLQTFRARAWTIRRGVLIHSTLVAMACVVVALYLGYWGLIGLRTWA